MRDRNDIMRPAVWGANHIANSRHASGQAPAHDADEISMAELDVAVLDSIEPIYVERLHDSGIHTIADLVQQTPARVAHFAGMSTWDESTQWIAEANALIVSLLVAPKDSMYITL